MTDGLAVAWLGPPEGLTCAICGAPFEPGDELVLRGGELFVRADGDGRIALRGARVECRSCVRIGDR